MLRNDGNSGIKEDTHLDCGVGIFIVDLTPFPSPAGRGELRGEVRKDVEVIAWRKL
jgi:hypothetical protein